MSMRSIVEFNHDRIQDLKDRGHISDELFRFLCDDHWREDNPLPGLRYLRMRHHTETVELWFADEGKHDEFLKLPEIGTKWRDNDPRCPYRVVTVVGHDTFSGKVGIQSAGRTTWTKAERFGRKGRSGFTPVSSEDSI